MGIVATEMKRGMAIEHDGRLMVIVDFQHTKPGKGGAFLQTRLKDLRTGQVLDYRFRSSDTIEPAALDRVDMVYSYSQGGQHYFMDMNTYEQVPLSDDVLGDAMNYLKPETPVQVRTHDEKAISIELPSAVELKIVDTPPAMKGATATNQYKRATLETGLVISVPPFINNGELIRVDTRSGEYLERVK
ncbi:MAG: elongation factor P [Planctomycetes bacterium]|nr:elongation factor P [Planctomycetota bacterium]